MGGGGGLIFGGDYTGRGLFSEFYGSLNEEMTEKETGRERKLLPLVNRGLRQDIKTTRVIHFQKCIEVSALSSSTWFSSSSHSEF